MRAREGDSVGEADGLRSRSDSSHSSPSYIFMVPLLDVEDAERSEQ